ncbi:MAG TPA: ATP-binding protein [Desulfuromonadales bacterium]|nr:ATP-binding protein [Desulfuromonadales bacterium]
MKFYNRKNELFRLDELFTDGKDRAHLFVLSGRRRVGKTSLIKHFTEDRDDFVYLFVSKKKSHLLLAEFSEILAERIPILKSVSINSFDSLFTVLFKEMSKTPLYIMIDEFQNFQQVDGSVFSVLQNLWDTYQDSAKGAIICVGSVQTLMRDIFEGEKEPLFNRASIKMSLKPLSVDTIAQILTDNGVDVAKNLLFYHTLFGGVPKYYAILDRSRLFHLTHKAVISRLFCEQDALLQQEGRDLLIEEFGKNYHLYFSILQTVAGGVTQMAQIADKTGINVNSISRYLDELVSEYGVLERRSPVTATTKDHKGGRYHIADHFLKFWFRYIHKNQTLVEIGATERLADKIDEDLTNFQGWVFEEMVREILINRNNEKIVPFLFDRISGFWDKSGKVEIDIVAADDDKKNIFFGECKLNGNQFTLADIAKLKEKGRYVHWGKESRTEYFALFSNSTLTRKTRELLDNNGVAGIDVRQLFPPPRECTHTFEPEQVIRDTELTETSSNPHISDDSTDLGRELGRTE